MSATLDFAFWTIDPTTRAPVVLTGSPAISVYKDNSLTQSTAGVTLTASFDGITGFNQVHIDTTADGSFYAAGSMFMVMVSAGTAGGVSQVGRVVAHFSIQKTSALRPTVASRTLDITATGAAGIDWGNVENPGTANALASTTLAKVTPIDIDGITFASWAEIIAAVLAGEATVSGSTVSFKRRDGITSKLTITYGASVGERTDSTINS